MAVAAEEVGVQVAARMLEFQTLRRDAAELLAAPLGENGVAGGAIARTDRDIAVDGAMFVVVATEATGPILVADVVGVGAPVGLHPGKELLLVNALDRGNGRRDFFRRLVFFAQDRGDALESLVLSLIHI